MPKISVIIPVYQTEQYIEKCLDSVKNQTMKDIEIIIVNDGSTDNSENVIKKYMQNNRKQNIKYFKKENGGLSDTRNFGVSKASGKYIMFLDSDDCIKETLFQELEQYINQDIDIIKYKMTTIDNEGNEIQKLDGPVFDKCTGEEAFAKLVGNDNFLEVACIYLYRRDFFVENNFKYNTTNKYHEDFGLTPLIIVNAKTVVSTNVFGYYYTQTDNSITRNLDYAKQVIKANDVLSHYDYMLESIKGYDISNETKYLLKKYYTNTVILKANELKDDEQKAYFKEIKKRKMYENIKVTNLKQLLKRILLRTNLKLYLKIKNRKC